MTGHVAWIIVGGCALVLLAGVVAAGVRTKRRKNIRRGQRVSYQMAALSSAAILAVYATGFQRTKEAADAFAARAARRREPGQAALSMAAPGAARHIAQAEPTKSPQVTDSPVPRRLKPREDRQRASSVAAQNTVAQLASHAAAQPDVNKSTPAAAAPAAASPQPAAAAEAAAAPTPKYKDGTFTGWGECTHGSIQASVVIESGKIASVAIARCETAYSCGWIANLPGEVVDWQTSNTDWVTGATDSSYAFMDAVAAALKAAVSGVRE